MRVVRPAFLSFALAALTVGQQAAAQPTAEPPHVRVERLLRQAPIVDGHNDLVIHFLAGDSLLGPDAYDLSRPTPGQTDLPRWRAGRVAGSFVTVGGAYSGDVEADLHATLGLLARLVARYPDDLVLARTAADVRAAHGVGRVALIPHVEGGEQLGGSLDRLRALHALGVRSVGLTWNHTNDLADAALDTVRWGGLSPLGEAVVREMNRLGVLVDLSHASDQTARDVFALSAAPVVFSHSSTRTLADLPRNVPDELLRRVAANGGVAMVTFVPYFTTAAYAAWYAEGEAVWDRIRVGHAENDGAAAAAMAAWEAAHPPPPVRLADVADHAEHVRRVAGVDHVGLGSDFDGMYSHVVGLEDVSTFPALLEELARRGWSDDELRKVSGENILRVMAAAERVASRSGGHQADGPAPGR